ncbi:CRISPR-associated protein Cas5h [Hydrogenispora ethanolica]|uniref:CRISPR-associated protein Cas5h n=1 Tax=Hydrogenispora ethanolica TaxID=1082276 RepID=A0A4R1QLT6_HYDET|nr:type I-B CRISPR-associated protein Cas5b [Hydrogenispora ethanolica]TCL54668.1 CRISPR-associated protein Cas5h [Hydrogenispora ethanolica]
MKILVFDIWSDFGHFRKYYTTSSPLTFSFPPPPTVAGMLGAIIGSNKESYLRDFSLDNMRLGIQLINPVRKIRLGINLINTKDNYWKPVHKKKHAPRTPIRTEFLHNPAFRIYIHHQDDALFTKLANLVKRHYAHYTLSMGLSELLADFRWVGLYEGQLRPPNLDELVSVIPEKYFKGDNLILETERRYFKERIPVYMTPERIVESYDNVIWEAEGKPLRLGNRTKEQIIVLENGDKICYF